MNKKLLRAPLTSEKVKLTNDMILRKDTAGYFIVQFFNGKKWVNIFSSDYWQDVIIWFTKYYKEG